MRLFHRTAAAAAILRGGFRDAEGSYGLGTWVLRGVWVSDEPLDINEGAVGEHVLEVAVPDGVDLSEFEVIEEGKGYREWCVPAALLNERCAARLLPSEELEGANWE